jgi:quinol monooxygenase YgiN
MAKKKLWGHMMSNAIWIITYKLVKGASVEDFLVALEKTNQEVLSKKNGFISWKVLRDGDTWVDMVTWETIEDAKNAEHDGEAPDPIAEKFYAFINFNSLKMRCFTIEKEY